MTRRDAVKVLGATATVAAMPVSSALAGPAAAMPGSSALAGPPAALPAIDVVRAAAVARNDAAVRKLLDAQITDPSSPWRGSIADEFGLHHAGSAGGLVETLTASFVEPSSTFHGDAALVTRIKEAAAFLERSQSPEGFVDLLTTNFHSPPDTGFVVHSVATAAAVAKMHGAPRITEILRPFLQKAGAGLTVGGIHTPNHRWVVCSALAQINELFPDAHYVERIDDWLVEGIDLELNGQFTERSTLVYNRVTDRALVVMAAKLGRPDLLAPVRRNLEAALLLLHADGEVVTEISHRQDQNTRGNLSGYWFPLTYLAVKERHGKFAALARQFASTAASLSALLEYPELSLPLPPSEPLPDNFEERIDGLDLVRIRRRLLSATLNGSSHRFFTLRYGDAAMEGVRFATAFFGKGQFSAGAFGKDGVRYEAYQPLEAPYYQPLQHKVLPEDWMRARAERAMTQVCKLTQSAEIQEMEGGFTVRIRAAGTAGIPLAVEITFRDGGTLDRTTGVYRAGRNFIKVGPLVNAHQYTQIRGAEPKLAGQTLYVTGYTPFDHTLSFECG